MSAPQSGLLLTQQTNYNVDNSYFLKKGDALVQPTLVSTVSIQGNLAEGGLAVPAKIQVPGTTHATPAYVGAMKLVPGGNAAAPASSNGVVIRAAAGPSTVVEVGTDGQGPNQLLIAGASGPSQVYDGAYNPVVKSAAIFEETFGLDSQVNNGVKQITFTVPKTGAYMLQININLANADLIPTLPNNFPGGAIEWTTTSAAIEPNEVQYLSSTLSADIFTKASQIGPVAEPMDYVFSSLGFFQTLGVGETYSFNMFALRPLDAGVPISRWNLSSIKVRLIQMC